jgi:hypothetical protein
MKRYLPYSLMFHYECRITMPPTHTENGRERLRYLHKVTPTFIVGTYLHILTHYKFLNTIIYFSLNCS